MTIYIPRQTISIEKTDVEKYLLLVKILNKMGVTVAYNSKIVRPESKEGPFLSDIMHEFNTRAQKAIILMLHCIGETPEDLTPTEFKVIVSYSDFHLIRGCGKRTIGDIYEILDKYD